LSWQAVAKVRSLAVAARQSVDSTDQLTTSDPGYSTFAAGSWRQKSGRGPIRPFLAALRSQLNLLFFTTVLFDGRLQEEA
jgi:hypothetical protein